LFELRFESLLNYLAIQLDTWQCRTCNRALMGYVISPFTNWWQCDVAHLRVWSCWSGTPHGFVG